MPPGTRQTALLLALAALECAPAAHAAGGDGTQPGTGCSGQRYPRFDRVLLLESAAATSANVGIGDLTGAGHPDLVLARGRRS